MRALLIAAIAVTSSAAHATPPSTTPTPTTPTTTTLDEAEAPSIWATPAPWLTILAGSVAAFGSSVATVYVPVAVGAELPTPALAVPFVVTSGAVVGTRLLLPEPTVLNVALPAVGASAGLLAGVVAGGIFGSWFLPEHTDEGTVRNTATTAGFAAGIVGGAAVGTALGIVVADLVE